MVALESTPGEKVVAAGEGSPSTAPPPEITDRLSALLWQGPAGTARINWEMKPWGEVKSKRGRKKKYVTQGYTCLNPACAYFGHTDEHIQALVRHTTRGKDKDIPYLCCQACQTVFTSRKGTPLYTLKAKPGQVEMVLWFLVDGVDMAVMVRDTWSLMSEPHLRLHAEWFRLYYHLARPHESLREPVPGFKRKYRPRTPAMALGLTDRVLTVGDILRMPLVPAVA